MTIYEELIRRVEDGESFYIDFEKQTMKVGKDYLIKNGEYDVERQLMGAPAANPMLIIEEFYRLYKYSLPSERSDGKRRKYFKALPIEKLTDWQLMTGAKREPSRARLEGFVLCAILNGDFVWDEPTMGKWFWASKNDPDLVILKSWIKK